MNPRKLWMVLDGSSRQSVKELFGNHRICVAFPARRPTWASSRHLLVEVQTLYGEYGGFLGSLQWLRGKRRQEQEKNLSSMLQILEELAAGSAFELYLEEEEEANETASARGELDIEYLLRFPSNRRVVFHQSST
ncbi:MAG: hypothetical protein AB7K24_33760 [Gemmataceae bacterium]